MSTVIGRPPEPGSDVLLPALDAAGFGRGDGDPYRVVVLPDGGVGAGDGHGRPGGWTGDRIDDRTGGRPGGRPDGRGGGRDGDGDGGPRADGRTLVVVCSPDDLARWAWDLLAAGADDVVLWTGEETVRHVVARLDRWRRVDATVAAAQAAGTIVGRSPALRAALLELVELAVYGDGPILLTGETGTGKELAARLVHDVGPGGPARPFVVVDCSTIVPTLSGSELFGHERGAFTGADRSRAGALSAADGGTLFLDEIGELPLGLQAELLRVVQEHTYKAVGGDVWARTEFRLVSATNRDLDAERRAGRFRSDLYHRIASGVVRMPPLRERTEDVELLFRHFLCRAMGTTSVEVTAPVLAMLRDRPFAGNLRELRQLAAAVAARHTGPGPVTPGEVPARERPATSGGAAADARRQLERAVRECVVSGVPLGELKTLVGDLAVETALARAGGSSKAAAAALGVTERAVQLRRRTAHPARQE